MTTFPLFSDLTFQCYVGQLGNRMFYYALVYGLSKLNNRNGFIQTCNIDSNSCQWINGTCHKERLDDIFFTSLPVRSDVPAIDQVHHQVQEHLSFPEDYHISPEANVITAIVPYSFSFFHHVKAEIHREFRFRHRYEQHAENVLKAARGNRTSPTYIGVHVRRGDMKPFLMRQGLSTAPLQFYKYAFEIFRQTFSNCLFVVLSDDLEWCRENIVDVDVFIPETAGTPGEDLAVLAHCNHSIIDVGTYGMWGAYLTRGITVHYMFSALEMLHFDPNSDYIFPVNWIRITPEMLTSDNETTPQT